MGVKTAHMMHLWSPGAHCTDIRFQLSRPVVWQLIWRLRSRNALPAAMWHLVGIYEALVPTADYVAVAP
jgi:hypothetical protein